MEALGLFAAMLMPCLLGVLMLSAYEPRLVISHRSLLLGNGLLLGLLTIPLLMRLIDHFGLEMSFTNTFIATSTLAALLLIFVILRYVLDGRPPVPVTHTEKLQEWDKVWFVLFVVLIVCRLLALTL
jgi:hypothetical protein